MSSPCDLMLYQWLLGASWISFLASLFFASVSAIGPDTLDLGLFIESVTGSNQRRDITPAPWTFGIWFFIFTYQIIWLIYATVNICRRGNNGRSLYSIGPFLHWTLFVAYIINAVSLIGWLFLWDRNYIIPALVALIVSDLSLGYAVYASIAGIYKYYPRLCAQGFRIENRLVTGLVTNGIEFFASWLLVATHLNLDRVLFESAGLSLPTSTGITISLLTFILALWFVLDMGVLEKYTRYLYAPYIVFPVAFTGILADNFDAENPNQIYITMLLIATIAMLLLKICLGMRNQRTNPAFPPCEERIKEETVIVYT